MPKSKGQRKQWRQSPPDPDAEARARRGRRDDLKRRLGWVMVILGVALFLLGQVGARTGFACPFHSIAITSYPKSVGCFWRSKV